jgi:hypothetical protein
MEPRRPDTGGEAELGPGTGTGAGTLEPRRPETLFIRDPASEVRRPGLPPGVPLLLIDGEDP